MADYRKLKPFILKWEGGFVDNKRDKGGATNKGITLNTFRLYFGKNKTVTDLKRMTDAQWDYIFLKGFWDKFCASSIASQAVADACVDWAWTSGPAVVKLRVQRILGVRVDGVIGPKTLAAINHADPKVLFERIRERRLRFVNNIVAQHPDQKVFLKGWVKRINAVK